MPTDASWLYFVNQNISLNFQTTKEKYNYTIGLSIDPSYSRSKVSVADSIIENLKQNVINFSPTLNFSYQPNDHTNLDISYSGSTSQPGITQLSADTVIVSALSKYYGNPNLKPSYSNNFNVYYRKSDYASNRYMMLSGGFNYTFNNKYLITASNRWDGASVLAEGKKWESFHAVSQCDQSVYYGNCI